MTKKKVWISFAALVAVALGLRFFLQLSEIDQYYGFYYANPVSDTWERIFLALLGLGVLGIILITRFFKPAAGSALVLHNRPLGICFVALGFMAEIGAYLTGFNVVMAIFGGYRISIADAATSGITVLAGLVMIFIGFSSLTGKPAKGGLFSALVIIAWMALTLITTFMYYPIVYNVSDNMLHILTLTAATAFFVYYFKILAGVGSQRDTVIAIVLGLSTAFFGIVLAVPRWYILSRQDINPFVPSVSQDDLMVVAVLSLLGLLTAVSLLQHPAAPAAAVEDEAAES